MSTLKRAGNALTSQDQIDIRRDIGLPLPTSGDAASGQVVTGGDSRLTDARTPSGTAIAAATSKTTPVDADSLPISDSAATGALKRLTWANVKATLKTYFDGLYVSLTGIKTINGQTLIGSGDLTVGGGSGAITGSGLTMATARLLGRSTAGTGAIEEITLGSNLSFSGTTLNAAGGGGASSISFTTTVPLTSSLSVMTATAVTGALAFSPATSPILMGSAYVRLTANGTNVPTFTGMVEHGSSAGWDNVSGRVNLLMFWWDGSNVWYSIQQPANAADLAAPTVSTAVIADATPTQIQITFSVALDTGSVPATSAFTISNSGGTDTVSAVAISGAVVTLTKSRTTLSTDTVTVGYTQPGTGRIRAASSGQDAATFSGQAVTNNVSSGGGTLAFVRANMTTAASLVEAGDATVGYTYTASIDTPTWSGAAFVESTPLMVDGSRITAEKTGTNNGMIGLTTATAPHRWDQAPQYAFGAFVLSGALNRIQGSSINAMSALADGALYSLRRSGTTVVLETSTDSGATWTTQHTWTGVSAGTTYRAVFNANGTGTTGPVVRPRGVGLSA